jgi:hypothetical protein
MPDSPSVAPNNAPSGEKAKFGHLLTCHRSQPIIKLARENLLALINCAIATKAEKEGKTQEAWDLTNMEWLNPEGLDHDIVAKLSRPRAPREIGLHVERRAEGGVTCKWVSEQEIEACPHKKRLQTANRIASWAGIPPKDLRPALKKSGLNDSEITTLWRRDLFPGIASALHEIRTTASDEERAWAEDRARHPEHIHVDYHDRWWPSEETGKRVMQTARRKVKAWGLANPKAHPPKEKKKKRKSEKKKLDAAMEEGEHVARMYELQRSPLQQKPSNWMAKGSLSTLQDAELLETMPTTMEWAMRRVLRDKEDVEFKEATKQQEREIDEESGAGEPARPAKRARIDTPTRDDDENVSDNSDTSDDADPNGRQEKAQEHKKARTDS